MVEMDDVEKIRTRMIEAKKRMRHRLAALSFTEKIRILEKLRDRELAIAASGLRRKEISNAGKGTDKVDR